jgi:outer membrane immunogenic protein
MRKLLLATTCAIGVSSVPTWAAAPTPVYSWTGCYLGGSAGGSWDHKGFTDTFFTSGFSGLAPPASPKADTSSWLAGGQVGCNYQFATNWLLGVEGADSWANLKSSSDPFFSGKAVFKAQTDSIASVTGRVGYAVNRWLLYAKGGTAWAHDKYQMPGSFAGVPFNYTGSEMRNGWTVGAGIEWAFWQNWSARVEYAHYDFGSHSLNLIDTGPVSALTGPDRSSITERIDTVTLGINFRFWTGPSAASD